MEQEKKIWEKKICEKKRMIENDIEEIIGKLEALNETIPGSGIMDLPLNVQITYLEHLEYDGLQSLRECSTQLYNLVNDYVMKKYHLAGHLLEPGSLTLAIHKSLTIIGDIFINAGFRDHFAAAILPMLSKADFCPTMENKKDCIKQFMMYMYTILAKDRIQLFQLLITMSILKYLKENKGAYIDQNQLIGTTEISLRISLHGGWLGNVKKKPPVVVLDQKGSPHESDLSSYEVRDKCTSLLVILSDLFIGAHNECTLGRIWYTSSSELYLYGHTEIDNEAENNSENYDNNENDGNSSDNNSNERPVAVFNINIIGDREIINFLQSWIKTGSSEFVWPQNLPTGGFSLELDCQSDETARMGCNSDHPIHLSINISDDN